MHLYSDEQTYSFAEADYDVGIKSPIFAAGLMMPQLPSAHTMLGLSANLGGSL